MTRILPRFPCDRVMLPPSLTGTNMRLDARDGYVNILLWPIPEVDVKD
ncbi:MAG: hypothetical protein ACO1NQ_00295 [Flavobacteriales bacterium]